MPTEVSCPRCGKLVDAQIHDCPYCGVDLALAAVLAERDLTQSFSTITVGAPIAPEILVPRLGAYLIERGYISAEDLDRALAYHQQLAAEGKPRLVGQVLLELGLVDRESLDTVVTEQILKLQDALQMANRQLEQRVQERTSELQRALSKLSELNQLKSNFISNISHELRTPLTHLRGYLSLMGEGSLGPLNETLSEACDVMLRAETRLEQLIDDLIQFSLATRGELSLNINYTDLTDVVSMSASRAVRQAKARRITLNTRLASNLPMVRVDGEKISWVLLQLLDNAIKFTPQGGTVTVETRAEPQGVYVAVTDTGIGIPEDRISEVFEPFHQLDGSETRRYGGCRFGVGFGAAHR